MDNVTQANLLNFMDERNFRYVYGPPRIVAGTSTADVGGGDSTIQITIPTAAVAGDAMFVAILVEGGADAHIISVPSGFQEITNNNDTFDVRGASFAKTLSAAEVAAGYVTFGATDAGRPDATPRMSAVAFLIQEAHQTDKRDDWLDADTAASANITFASLTSNVDNCLHVLMAFQDSIATHTAPSGYTKHVQYQGTFGTISIHHKPIPIAGVTGSQVVTSDSAVRWLAQSVTVPPFPDTP